MEFKDYYATLGVGPTATPDEIKRAYRKLARKYHPDVSKVPDAESRFKEVGEAYEVLKDTDKRAAYDVAGQQWRSGQEFKPPPDWERGFEFSGRDFDMGGAGDRSDFFEALFGGLSRGRRAHGQARTGEEWTINARGEDHHAKVLIDLEDSYRDVRRTISLRVPVIDEHGQVRLRDRTVDVAIPKGILEGQHLRLAGQGGPGFGKGPPGDLYLEVAFRPHPLFRIDGRDVYFDVPLAPWEAALGASVAVPTPQGSKLELKIPPGSPAGRKLRFKGKGIPAQPPGDLYAVLAIALPPADTPVGREAYRAMAEAFQFNPRAAYEE
jgi:curved DNA-binding protein